MKNFRFISDRIPRGCYCYDSKGVCPFWDIDLDAPTQDNGYCHFLGIGDHNRFGDGFLWDQCKDCGINDEEEKP